MRDGDFGLLPVGEEEHLLGVITDRDITVRAVAEGRDPTSTPVRDVVSEGVIWAHEDDSVEDAARVMSDRQIRRLPIVDAGQRLVGIVSLGDFAVDSSDIRPVVEALSDISSPAKEPLNKSHAGATTALRDRMRERRRSEWSTPFARSLTKRAARKALSRSGCGKIGRSLRYTPWHRRPSYDLRRAPCDHPDFTSNALRGGFVQRFPSSSARGFTPTRSSRVVSRRCRKPPD